MTTTLRAGSATDVGRVRSANQDSKLINDTVYAVADGMGGHQGGEVASQIAVEVLDHAVILPTLDSLLEAAHAANDAVLDKASSTLELKGMGTTLCALALVENDEGDDEIALVSVGDSRIYLYRDEDLLQLTTDHSLVEDLRRDGQLTDEEAAVHPQRNILTRALGIDPDVIIDAKTVIPFTGDRFLICSDGLFNEVEEALMAATLRRLADPTEAASELVRLANEHGGRDNITCVVVDVVDDGGRSVAASAGVAGTAESGDDPTTVQARTDPDDVAGFSAPAPARTHDDELWDKAVQHESEDHFSKDLKRGKVKHVTWRVVLFFVALLLIAAVAIGFIGYSSRNSYYVGYKGDTVAIYKGKPGGVLWFKPTLEQVTKVNKSDVPAEFQDDLAKGKERSSVSASVDYVQSIRDKIAQLDAATTTTTTTTTTTAPTTLIPTTTLVPPITAVTPP